MFIAIILYRGLDGVFRKYRAVDLDRRQRKFFSDLGVPDSSSFVESFAFDPLRNQRTARDR